MTVRTCIKCGRELPSGMFDDNWRHRVNECRDCKREYQRKYNAEIHERKECARIAQLHSKIQSGSKS